MTLLRRGADGDEQEEILLHLRELLNTRLGESMLAADYGLPDSNDLALQAAPPGRVMCRAIRVCLDRYEPRLQILDVAEQPNDPGTIRLGFLVRARCRTGRQGELTLATSLDIGGRVSVAVYD